MPRRREVPKRNILPDPKFGSQEVSKFVNVLMTGGKKSVAERILYGAFDQVTQKSGKDALEVFTLAINNLRPIVEVKSRRVGGSNYQVPVEVRPDRRQALAIRWLIEFSRDRAGRSMREKLAAELFDAANKRGGAIKRREDVHKMAEANKAFAHFRW
jgi:small subunit ribosomal protein S7